MKFFVDSADVEEIKQAKALGLADGVTTNPTLIRKSGRPFQEVISEISTLIDGPILAEPVGTTRDAILAEGRELARWAPQVVVKIPLTRAGLEAVHQLHQEGVRTALTLIFSPAQALLAAKAGAEIICPFVGRLDDIASSGMDLIRQIVDLYTPYPEIETEVIVASVRTPNHVVEAAEAGADGVTLPFKVVEQMMHHPLTDLGIQKFIEDWQRKT